jgi:hypothetical protein
MDTKKIDEFTVMLHKCVSDRDESRKALLKAEDFEGQWQFQKNCKAIIDRDMKREDVQVRYNSACLEDNKSLRDQIYIEFMICDYVANIESINEDLRTELKGQRRTYEAATQIVNRDSVVPIINTDHNLAIIQNVGGIYTDNFNYAKRLGVFRDAFSFGEHNANNGDVCVIVSRLDGKEKYICSVRLCKDQTIVIIDERNIKAITL